MSESFVFAKTLPLYSIVNPSVLERDYLDYEAPFSFFDFLKYTKADLSPLQFNDLYLAYLKEWNVVKVRNNGQAEQSIQERYVELIKEITLKHTSFEERRFLSNIDYTDETELDIIVPFYSIKINEICKFYSDKREKLKYKVQKNKIKGTNVSIEKTINETVIDTIFSGTFDVAAKKTLQKPIIQQELLDQLKIEIEPLYDTYTSYYDNDPTESDKTYDVNTELRKKLYSANLNAIDANIFVNFDEAVKNKLFENIRMFLTEFGKIFTINYGLDQVDLNCKPDQKLYNLVSAEKPKSTKLVALNSDLIKKYIGSDIYYIQTGTTITDVTSGILVKADSPSQNLLNRHYPTTATIEEESALLSERDIGLFFTPDKNSILYFSVPEKIYKIDTSKLKPDSVYVFPDPTLYGNTMGVSRIFDKKYPLIHICEYTKSVKNKSHNYSSGDIASSPFHQDYYSYFSRHQIGNSYELGLNGLKSNFASLYNKGIIYRWNSDIYGNQYGLVKNRPKQKLIDNSFSEEIIQTECEEYDGGPITFFKNGILPEVVLASNPKWVSPNVWASNYYYNVLIEGGIGGYKYEMMERGIYWEGYSVDGLMINESLRLNETFDINFNVYNPTVLFTYDGNAYNDTPPITINSEFNNTSSSLYDSYTYVVDDLFYSRNPQNNIKARPSKTLDGNPLGNTSEFPPKFNNEYTLSSIKSKEFDAGKISDYCDVEFNFEDQTNHIIHETLSASRTIIDTIDEVLPLTAPEKRKQFGSIYINNVVTNVVTPLTAAMEVQFKKYTQTPSLTGLRDQLDRQVLDFNVYNDFLWIRTNEYIVFEKIGYSGNEYVYSGTDLSYIQYKSKGSISEITNPFIFENKDYSMVVLLSASNIDSNNFSIVPSFYKIDSNTAKYQKLNISTAISAISTVIAATSAIYVNDSNKNNIKLFKINPPVLTYNSRNDKYCVMTTIEDLNEFFYIYSMKFNFEGQDIINLKINLYTLNYKNSINTLNFNDITNLEDLKIIQNDITQDTNINIDGGALVLG